MHELSTPFYTVTQSQGVALDERLIARSAPNGKYAVRSEYADTDVNGPGIASHPFNILARIKDRLNGHRDYTLSEAAVRDIMARFNATHTACNRNFA